MEVLSRNPAFVVARCPGQPPESSIRHKAHSDANARPLAAAGCQVLHAGQLGRLRLR